MKDGELQSLLSIVGPPRGVGLPSFISAATRALGGRSDADLARAMGVPPSSIANWKRRGAVPDDYARWFTTALIEKMATHSGSVLPEVSLLARCAVVRFLVDTRGAIFGDEPSGTNVAARALGGLLSLAEFFADRYHAEYDKEADVSATLEFLKLAMHQFRRGDQFR